MRQILLLLLFFPFLLPAQNFHFGNDLSYVNEMESCGVVYKENGQPKDPYQIFADHGGTLVRLRLWHTPNWYDDLNSGQRFSDLADVRQSIQRAKDAGMQVLLDFHLSDNWADPQKQLVPAAWLDVVDDLPTLQDSLYNYISQTLLSLHADGLLPEMVQIGNETNKGILLSPDDNATWTLEWPRNAALFNTAIQAVRDVENSTGESVSVAIHAAGPANTEWLIGEFVANGVTDFDLIGISYYWAWHQPTNIAQTGDVISSLRQTYPSKQVMIFETGYPWTLASNDNANNIISDLNADYSPASPEAQRQWLIDLTAEVMANDGAGVIYWESAWVSSDCWTQWGQGSHQEHATFFDFENNLLEDGGIAWMSHDYSTPTVEKFAEGKMKTWLSADQRTLHLQLVNISLDTSAMLTFADSQGRILVNEKLGVGNVFVVSLPELAPGVYFVTVVERGQVIFEEKISVVR